MIRFKIVSVKSHGPRVLQNTSIASHIYICGNGFFSQPPISMITLYCCQTLEPKGQRPQMSFDAAHERKQSVRDAKRTAAGIPTWSPTVVLICRSTAYVWQSGRDAQFSADCGRTCLDQLILSFLYLNHIVLRYQPHHICVVEKGFNTSLTVKLFYMYIYGENLSYVHHRTI
jgi:hypothetical protein